MKLTDYFWYYFIVRWCFVSSTFISKNYSYYNNQIKYVISCIKHTFFDVIFIIRFGINYLARVYERLYNKFIVSGFKKLSPNIAIFTFLYKDKITRIPLQISPYSNSTILSIKYKIQPNEEYVEDKHFTKYIKTFLDNRFSNIQVKPKLIGFDSLLITVLDEECNEIEKEYKSNDVIE